METPVHSIPRGFAEQIYRNPCTRYFLIKSFNSENVSTALQQNVWATTPRNETILTQALESSSHVVLMFSVNGSSRFAGYAVMKSRPGESLVPPNVFVTPDGRSFRGRTFDVQWIRRVELPFQECAHLRNPLNDNKPIRIGRDGQEIDTDVGRQLCELFEEKLMLNASMGGFVPNGPYDIQGCMTWPAQQQQRHVACIPMGYAAPYVDQQQQMMLPQGGRRGVMSDVSVDQQHMGGGPLGPRNDHPNQGFGSTGVHNGGQMMMPLEGMMMYDESQPQESMVNAALQVFPIDVTNMSYDKYISMYQKSQSLWQSMQANGGPPPQQTS